MIAKYKDRYFCVDTSVSPMQLWAYAPVECFEKKATRRGTVYYQKFVDITGIDEIFEVAFAVEWKGTIFSTPSIKEEKVYIRTVNKDEAVKCGLQEEVFDRGEPVVWSKMVDIAEVEKFYLYKTVYAVKYFTEKNRDAKQKTELVLSKGEWLDMRTKMEAELSPWNYTDKNRHPRLINKKGES